MSQLLMRRPDLTGLPVLPKLSDLALRPARPGDEETLAALLRTAFDDDGWTAASVRPKLLDAADVNATYVITDRDIVVATASARLLPEAFPGAGYVHMVAARSDYAGRRLGYTVSLAVLLEFVLLGCQEAVLETDDPRLPAIKTYFRLGFLPVLRDESHRARWAAVESALQNAATPGRSEVSA